ncbi:MAG: DUF6507 family protein [Pseudonocardiales bacterium]
MNGWDISPSGVRGVLPQTEAVAQAFEGHLTSMNSAIEGAAAETSSGPIITALTGWLDKQRPNINFMFTRTGACITGAAQATNAYIDGDETMAANAQAAATAAPDLGATMPGRSGQPP